MGFGSKLPDGKTCADCAEFQRCNLHGAQSEWTECDFSPSEFTPLDADEHDWILYFDDPACPPQLFGGTEQHAMKVLEEAGQNWTCHLYKRIASA